MKVEEVSEISRIQIILASSSLVNSWVLFQVMGRYWKILSKGVMWHDLQFTSVYLPSLKLPLEGGRRRWGRHTTSSPVPILPHQITFS